MLFNTIELMIPLLLASMGGLFSEKAGILNISLEGMILAAAFSAFAVAEMTGSLMIAILFALLTALFLSQLFSLGALILKGNIYVVGLAVNLGVYPMTDGLSRLFFQQGGALRGTRFIPPLRWGYNLMQNREWTGIFAGHNFFLPLAILVMTATVLFFRYSRWGFRMELQGISPERAREKSISPILQRWIALMLSALLCGLAGASLSLPLGSYVPSMSAGKGWIALVIIYLGEKKALPMLAGVIFFALMESLAIEAQGFWNIHPNIILSLPYFLTLAALLIKNLFFGKDPLSHNV